MATISFNPVLTTTASGSFSSQTEGYIQGTALNDPSVRNYLAGGQLSENETLPMWGGVGIGEDIPTGQPSRSLQGNIIRATSLTNLTGFSVFDQDHAMITTPQSPVPLAGSDMLVNFYRLGSGARIVVACDPSLISLQGGLINQSVSWDYVNQLLVPYLGTLTITSGTYVSGTGVVTLTMSAPISFSPGDAVVTSSLTGTGAYASLNGTFTALAGTGGSTVVYNAGAGLGAAAITGGSLTLGSGASSLLPAKVLDVNQSNSLTVSFDSVTKFATWNRSGTAAVILI